MEWYMPDNVGITTRYGIFCVSSFAKRSYFGLLLILIQITTVVAQFQSETERQTTDFQTSYKTNLFVPLYGPIMYTGEYRLVYETSMSQMQSIQVGASYLGKSLLYWAAEMQYQDSLGSYLKISGFRFQFAYKFYLKSQFSTEGFYVAPYVSFARARLSDAHSILFNSYLQLEKLTPGAIWGYQTKTLDGYVVDFFVGFAHKQFVYKEVDYPVKLDADFFQLVPGSFQLLLGFNLGFSD